MMRTHLRDELELLERIGALSTEEIKQNAAPRGRFIEPHDGARLALGSSAR